MDSLTHVLGALGIGALVAIFVVVIVAAVVVIKIRQVLRALVVGAAKSASVPTRIHVMDAPTVVWKDADAINANREAARQAGFTGLGTFMIKEMPGVMLAAFVKASESAYCIIYEHPRAGVWSDLVTKYDDGTGLTVSSSPRGGELDPRPGQRKVNEKGAGVAQLYARMVEERGTKPRKQLSGSKEEWVAIFEQAYADEMDWRNSRGGATADEIRRVAQASGKQVSAQTVGLVEEVKNKQASLGLIVAFEEKLKAKQKYDENTWNEMRPRLLFIHDRLPLDMLKDMAGAHGGQLNVPPSLPPTTSVRQWFTTMNMQLPVNRRFEMLTTVDAPIEADVYLAPKTVSVS